MQYSKRGANALLFFLKNAEGALKCRVPTVPVNSINCWSVEDILYFRSSQDNHTIAAAQFYGKNITRVRSCLFSNTFDFLLCNMLKLNY